MTRITQELQSALRSADLEKETQEGRRGLLFSRQLETAYRTDTSEWRRKHYRRSALMALLSYNAFLFVDAVVVPDVIRYSMILHLAVVTPLMVLAAVLLSRPVSHHVSEAIGAMMPLVFLSQVELVFLASRSPTVDHYQYLVFFAVMFGNTILRLPFYRAAAVSIIVVITHASIAFAHVDMPWPAAVMGVMGLVATAYITLLSSAIQEGAYRRAWLKRRHVEMQSHDLTRDNDKLSQLSRIDPLTGVKNRRGFDLAVEHLLGAPPGAELPFCLIMVDVDHFKSFNDTYGHGAGDEALCRVAQVLVRSLRRERDVVARFGGEEFIVFLPDVFLEEGIALAERARRALVAEAIPHLRQDGGQVVTASFGVAEGRLSGLAALNDVIAHADVALYEAKKAGRNRVEPRPIRRATQNDASQPAASARG